MWPFVSLFHYLEKCGFGLREGCDTHDKMNKSGGRKDIGGRKQLRRSKNSTKFCNLQNRGTRKAARLCE